MKSLRIIPIKGGFVLLEEETPKDVYVNDLRQVVGKDYPYHLTDAVQAWRNEQSLAETNTPPETS